ncbi:MAG: hypothetical protein EBU82_14160 [Flavobacteriia bacterium]|nr:hypothetical protein [Flavobacteriia bacterium]
MYKRQESNWFAKPLREASILRRLEHNWKGDSVKTSGWFTATWIPISLEITPSSFILSWSILKFEESNPRISSRFLSLSEPPTPRSQSPDSLQNVERSPPIRQFVYQPQESNDLEQIYDIPLSTDSNEIDLEEQRKERQSIREARLRVEVAQMKLEKYLQNYYRKYGDIPDESDSETSSLEDSD